MPARDRWSAVPPVERISTPLTSRNFASSVMPVLSETERSARSTACFVMENQIAFPEHGGAADVAAGLAPDVVEEIHVVGHRPRVRDRRHAERGGAVVELRRGPPAPAAEVLLVE